MCACACAIDAKNYLQKSIMKSESNDSMCATMMCLLYFLCPVQMCVWERKRLNVQVSMYVSVCLKGRRWKTNWWSHESTEQKRNEKISKIYKWNTARCKQSKDSFFQYIFVFASNIYDVYIWKKKLAMYKKSKSFQFIFQL